MNNKPTHLLLFTFFVFTILNTNAQNLSANVLDSITQQPIPYATVQLKEKCQKRKNNRTIRNMGGSMKRSHYQ